MSRVLKTLLKLRTPADFPAGSQAAKAPARSAPAERRALPALAALSGLMIFTLLAWHGTRYYRTGKGRAPASVPAVAPGLSEQELFLRNRQAVLGFYNGSLDSSAAEIRALLAKKLPGGVRAEAALHANLGAILLRQGKLTEARTAFVLALARDPAASAAHHGLGQLALRENELDEAEENFLLALKNAPERPEALLSLGQIAELKGAWPGAQGFYKRFLASAADPSLKAQIADRLRKIDERLPGARKAE